MEVLAELKHAIYNYLVLLKILSELKVIMPHNNLISLRSI